MAGNTPLAHTATDHANPATHLLPSPNDHLLQAIATNDPDSILDWTQRGASIHLRGPEGETLMHYAAMNQAPAACQQLKALGISMETPDDFGRTPFHIVAADDIRLMVHQMTHMGANINAQTSQGLTPLMLAIQHGSVASALALIDAGADASIADHQRMTACMHALENDQRVIARAILLKGFPPPSHQDIAAAFAPEVAEAHHRKLAEILPTTFGNRLDKALQDDNAAEVQRLIGMGADPSSRNHHGMNALQTAIRCNASACVAMLAKAHPELLESRLGDFTIGQLVDYYRHDHLHVLLSKAEPAIETKPGSPRNWQQILEAPGSPPSGKPSTSSHSPSMSGP